jgi:hypothetical protein
MRRHSRWRTTLLQAVADELCVTSVAYLTIRHAEERRLAGWHFTSSTVRTHVTCISDQSIQACNRGTRHDPFTESCIARSTIVTWALPGGHSVSSTFHSSLSPGTSTGHASWPGQRWPGQIRVRPQLLPDPATRPVWLLEPLRYPGERPWLVIGIPIHFHSATR